MKRRTVKILVAIIVLLIILGSIIGLVLGLLSQNYIKLEVWPRSEDDQPLIQFHNKDPGTWHPLLQSINDLLREYRKNGSGRSDAAGAENRVACSATWAYLGGNQVCDVPVDDFFPCTSSNQYNYEEAAPCVFLKLNQILDWKPVPFNRSEELPANMPEDLKQYIRMVDGRPESNMVWVSCQGENPVDVENIGPIAYIPRRGFPTYYYPFTNKQGYLSPLVAVLFERPKKGVLINIECKAWAKNIQYDRYERVGYGHFKLMVDRS